MSKSQIITEWVTMLALTIIFISAFCSGSTYSWGWRLIAYFGDILLHMKGA